MLQVEIFSGFLSINVKSTAEPSADALKGPGGRSSCFIWVYEKHKKVFKPVLTESEAADC